MSEAKEQQIVFEWASWNTSKYPDLKLLYAIPNGGRRDKKEAYFMKLSGVKAGVPDICLPVAKGNYHGLYIELKVGKNKTTYLQDMWLKNLAERHYKVSVKYGADEAIKEIKDYLEEK